MAYTVINFKTKKDLKAAVAAGQRVEVFQPGPFGPSVDTRNGKEISLEGPHYPKPHTWYARAVIENGVVVSVK